MNEANLISGDISEKVVTIDFYWDSGREGVVLVLINNTGLSNDELVKEIEERLDEYRENNLDYDVEGWIDILNNIEGVTVLAGIGYGPDGVETDYAIYF